MKELKHAVKTLKIIRTSIKVFFIALIILAIIISALHVFMMFRGKTLIIEKLQEITQRKTTIGYVTVTPIFNLEIKNLNIEGLAQVENIYISPSLLYLLTGKIGLNKVTITRPLITYEKAPAQSKEQPSVGALEAAGAGSVSPSPIPQPQPQRQLRFVLKRLVIKDGSVTFMDKSVGGEGIKLTVREINFKLVSTATLFPSSEITSFELKGKIPWREGEVEGEIEAGGWLNFTRKDMQATVKIMDIDGIYFYPYYSQWVDLEKARIDKAKMNFTSNIQGLNNNVTAECHLELMDIVRKERGPEESVENAERIADAVMDIFKAMNQGKIVLDFTIRTKMDKPQFGFSNFKDAVEDKLTASQKKDKFGLDDIFKLPGRIIEGTLKGTGDMTKSVITGTVEAGKEIGKAVFKKK